MSARHHAAINPDQPVDEREEVARRYVQQLRAFYIHAINFAVGILVMFVVNLVINLRLGIVGEWAAWWSVWAFVGWGIGIAVHGVVVWLNRPSLASSTWEQRQIDKVLGR